MSRIVQLNKSMHKWLSLFVGIQLIIWLGTGLYFNLMDQDKATGNSLRESVVHQGNIHQFNMVPINSLTQPNPQSVQFIWILGKPYYQLNYQLQPHSYQKNTRLVVDATNGEPFKLSAEMAQTIAQQSFKPETDINPLKVAVVSPPIDELPKEQNELWKVIMNDSAETHVYLDRQTGRVVAHINNDRRLRDFMFMLHFMDYQKTGGFNHWLIVVFAIGTLVLSSTGVLWLIELLKNKQLSISLRRKSKVVSLLTHEHASKTQLMLDKNKSILEGLAEKSILLPSTCGGGGACGQCKFRTEQSLLITNADKKLLRQTELERGFRLACQHKVSEVNDIEIDESR